MNITTPRLIIAECLAVAMVVLSGLSGCVTHTEEPVTKAVTLDEAGVARHIPSTVKDREGWSEDILGALIAIHKEPTPERVCSIIAVIQQESGFEKNPAVANLPEIVRQGLEKKFEKLGILTGPAVAALLAGSAPGGHQTFGERIDKLKTERDLDRLFRDLSLAYHESMPGTYAVASAMTVLMGKGALRDLNPVTTAGSMQVKVSFAHSMPGNENLSDDDIREQLYTRAGGIRYGAARLINYPARYDDIIYRFADYNAGIYTSRNAAFQVMLSQLTGILLALDGDILNYDSDGNPKSVESQTMKALAAFAASHSISSWTINRDARKEKTEDFEYTTSWKEVRVAWEKKTGGNAPYAQLPNVLLNSPKLKKSRSTSWFATAVKEHYESCRSRD